MGLMSVEPGSWKPSVKPNFSPSQVELVPTCEVGQEDSTKLQIQGVVLRMNRNR